MQTTLWRCNIVEIIDAGVPQLVIGHHFWIISDKFRELILQNHNTTKFLWQIAARAVSNKGKVTKGSHGIPSLKVLLKVMTKHDQFMTSKKW